MGRPTVKRQFRNERLVEKEIQKKKKKPAEAAEEEEARVGRT